MKLTTEVVKNLVKELQEVIPDVRVNAEYYLNLEKARKLIKKSTKSKKVTEFESYLVKAHAPENIVDEIPIVATLDALEIFYGRPRAGFTIHSDGRAILGYNKNVHTDKVIEILGKYKIPAEIA